ncbi:MAG: aminotransferase class I/II-fold pyridoxal phosphate-dependent enzyme, partial [Nitrosospira sp.]|nr:aminotransferase class I/II-fold pyridoxal phosphate-dependent enzyme [Nitrosospira sp.]
MNLCDLAPEYIRAISPYQPGKPISELARELDMVEHSIIKLASNENPLGTSPLALEAMKRALDTVALYPDGSGFELKAALSQRYGVTSSQIVLGNGSNDVLELIARSFLAPGRQALFSEHAFAVYPLASLAAGADLCVVPALPADHPEQPLGHNLQAMAAQLNDRTAVVFIANPNNPTGTWCSPQVLEAFMRQVPAVTAVVLDEAYFEYMDAAIRPDSRAWLERFPNLIITRTFSKIHALAGL